MYLHGVGCNATWTFHLLPGLKWGPLSFLLLPYALTKFHWKKKHLLTRLPFPSVLTLSPSPFPCSLTPTILQWFLFPSTPHQSQPPVRIPHSLWECAEGHQDEELGLPLHTPLREGQTGQGAARYRPRLWYFCEWRATSYVGVSLFVIRILHRKENTCTCPSHSGVGGVCCIEEKGFSVWHHIHDCMLIGASRI